ncbi:hypothetical protein MesoLj131c_47160 [Mesorhizobium sp. 131-3-5]|uniref:hypothetical protein n=1 Tax=Mesorhizobium sp. 131-3-5 TaxID=2744520 RepID=UPI001927C1D3|nr:hypothetical protein [Mesorhizobium sp. 131-3-5]BCH10458.1 hypothetical protein MesoLj131c_47160 [Mesorhizobium sp. 131-3-5]
MKRGKRPLPGRLRVIEGSYRADRHGLLSTDHQIAAEQRLIKPDWMRGGVADAWDRYIAPAGWLDVFREPSAIAFCELWQEFQSWPARFPASKHAQMRAYMGELALLGRSGRI